jgi:hypothetical protein
VSRGPSSTHSPAQAWAALAPILAGQPRVRLSRDAGKTYPQKHERTLSETLPTFPAAVRIFGKDGTCAAIFLDFDSSVAGIDWVEADVRSVQTWLHSCGARWIEDFAQRWQRLHRSLRVTFSKARDLVEAPGPVPELDKTWYRTSAWWHTDPAARGATGNSPCQRPWPRRSLPVTATVWATMNADLAESAVRHPSRARSHRHH